MRCYAIGTDGVVIEQRSGLTAKQLSEGAVLVIALDRPGEKKGESSTAWNVGDVIPNNLILSRDQLYAMLQLPKAHITNAIVYANARLPK